MRIYLQPVIISLDLRKDMVVLMRYILSDVVSDYYNKSGCTLHLSKTFDKVNYHGLF